MNMLCCVKTNSTEDTPGTPEKTSTPENGLAKDTEEPEVEQNRSCTDIIFLVLFGVFLFVLFVLLGYCMSYGDIYRIVNGYDDCGNVCGRPNDFTDTNTGCKGMDYTAYPYLQVNSEGLETTDPTAISRRCVDSCIAFPLYEAIGYRCLPLRTYQENTYVSKTGLVEFYQEVSEDLNACWTDIIWLSLIAFIFSFLILVLFRYAIRVIVWLVLIGVVVLCISATIFLWVMYGTEKNSGSEKNTTIDQRRITTYLVAAIISTIVTVIVCLVIFGLRKRIKLVIELFKEAGKACSSMPLLIFEPVLTIVALICLVTLWMYFAIWIESSGHLTIENSTSAKYTKDATIYVTRWYNVITLFWMSQVIVGCQHMVIAGAVASWFFTRNKSNLSWPIRDSFQRLLRYHLGTVCFGALIIALVKIVRFFFRCLEALTREAQNPVTRCLFTCCQCCLGCVEETIKYLTRNAYIETALSGQPFCAAGRKAATILASNSLRVFAINSVGDFVLLLGKAFVVAITVLIGIDMIQRRGDVHHSWVPIVLAGVIAYLIAHCFITVYEMTIDTIFICFCEDCERNDGIARPYYMSRSLMQFVQNSKQALGVTDNTSASGKAWSTGKNPNAVDALSTV